MSKRITLEQLNAEVIEAIEDKKGLDIITINVQGRCSFADQFILATGRTDRQLKALANGVRQVGHQYELTARIDGMEALEWLVVDLGDIVVHLFLPEVRESFQLERLWSVPEETTDKDSAKDA
ncbi:MAG: ribosome silencing factor [Ghiorsea sp.]|nr:ribosome silencing factor [Ghiorsea sp.]